MKSMNGMMKLWVVMFLAFLFCGCGQSSNKSETDGKETRDSIVKDVDNKNTKIKLFGVETEPDEYSVVKNLAAADILKVDTVEVENGKFQGAIVEFQGVKFGMNRGFCFITSRHDIKAVNSLIEGISKYYGKPEVDDAGEPEYSYYHWNYLRQDTTAPYIRIRPLHSADGGLTMTWDLQ
jgi:lipoprotein